MVKRFQKVGKVPFFRWLKSAKVRKVPLLRRPKITRMSNKCKKFENGEDEKVESAYTPVSYTHLTLPTILLV